MSKYLYAAKTKEEELLYKKFDGIFSFLETSYKLYGRMRFRGSKFVRNPSPEMSRLGEESVAEHLFACILLWQLLEPVLPHLSKLIDDSIISRMILIHDVGEVAKGDVSAEDQLKGKHKNRKFIEKNAFEKLIKKLPIESRGVFDQINKRYEKEKADKKTSDITVLTAKIVDCIQGGHFLLVNSIDFAKYADVYQKVMDAGTFPYTSAILDALDMRGNNEAKREVRILTKYYLYLYEKNGAKMISNGII